MLIFAHRGLGDKYPENSYEGLKASIESGFSIEIDLRLTKDGDFVIIHDDNLQRLCRQKIPVASLTLDLLTKKHYKDKIDKLLPYKLSSFEKFCRLLSKESGKNPLAAIHLKADGQTKPGLALLAQYFRKYNLYSKAFVFDLTKKAARSLKKIENEIQTALLVSEHKFEPTVYLWEEIQDFDFDIVWAAEWRKFYTKQLIDTVKSTGRSIYAVSPDVHKALGHPRAFQGYEETWSNLCKWGVDGICTDLPYELNEAL